MIGSSDGAKFRNFAQGLTLEYLVRLANQRLQRLDGRYQLIRASELQQQTLSADRDNLTLKIIDTWQGDVVRDTKTLSGGESFLVSLALALALSDLVSHKTSIDCLFLDEGFGTLDPEALDMALHTLESLNQDGKLIGVISHVDAMKDRIANQIKVSKARGLGFSHLDKQFAAN
jgi:exonuclease SbcC